VEQEMLLQIGDILRPLVTLVAFQRLIKPLLKSRQFRKTSVWKTSLLRKITSSIRLPSAIGRQEGKNWSKQEYA
jgi:hypothetical protein